MLSVFLGLVVAKFSCCKRRAVCLLAVVEKNGYVTPYSLLSWLRSADPRLTYLIRHWAGYYQLPHPQTSVVHVDMLQNAVHFD